MRHVAVRSRFLPALALALAVCSAPACRAQQDALPAPPESVQDGLQQIAAHAAVIFTGTVARVSEAGSAAKVMFAVEDGIRGVANGAAYTMVLSPWAGSADRYVVGERALFLLHAPSAAGYSSPVDGERGIVPLTGDQLSGSVDLRWIAAGVLRTAPVQSALETPEAPVRVAAGVSAASVSGARLGEAASLLRASSVTGVDVHAIDRDLVTAMLRTWTNAASLSKAQVR